MLKNQNTVFDTASTVNEPAVAPSDLAAVNKYVLSDIICGLEAAIELADAADALAVALCGTPDQSDPVHAVLYRAIDELKAQTEALCALL